MIWIQLVGALLCGGLSLRRLWPRDRAERGFWPVAGLVSTATMVAVGAFFATYVLVGVLLGLLWMVVGLAP
ncbi:hypothetical protein AB0I53_07100 [Saccharopolyspora sp. NPDC050389]|uniref:hypothetical protein n=1 Tax=Saccharopolyspora sp. NPDC050389 TaxID=3155516 RepID=UPI003403EF0F